MRPVSINRASGWGPEDANPQGRGFYEVTYAVRCRQCANCLRARTRMWVARAAAETSACAAQGRRSWFGTLTFRPEVHDLHEQLAFEEWADAQPGASVTKARFDALPFDERFAFRRHQALKEVQRYWKRLRKAGCRFRYFLVFEPHKSGRVHMHWLLHEQGGPILYRQLEAAWGRGHTKIVLVGGRSKRSAAPRNAAFYVAKYLSKSYQSRQLASARYGQRPPIRPPLKAPVRDSLTISPPGREANVTTTTPDDDAISVPPVSESVPGEQSGLFSHS